MLTPHEMLQCLKHALLQRKFTVSDAGGTDAGFTAVSRNYAYSNIRITARPVEIGVFATICYRDAHLNKKSEAVIQRNYGNFFELSDTDGAWVCISAELKTESDIENIAKTLSDAYSMAVLLE